MKRKRKQLIVALIVFSLLITSYQEICFFHSTINSDHQATCYEKEHPIVDNTSLVNSQPEDNSYSNPQWNISYPPYIERLEGNSKVFAMEVDAKNNRIFYYLYYEGLGVTYFKNNSDEIKETFFITKEHLEKNLIVDLIFDENASRLYAATYLGLYVINVTDWSIEIFNTSNGLTDHYVRSLAFDSEHELLYISTYYGGLNILFTNNLTLYDRSTLPLKLRNFSGELAYNTITEELYSSTAKELWCYNFSTNSVVTIFECWSYEYADIDSLFFDAHGNTLFLGCHGIIIFNCSSQTVIENYNQNDGLASNLVYEICYISRYGGLVICTQKNEGVAILNTTSEEITLIRREHGLFSNLRGSINIYTSNLTSNLLIIGTRGAITLYSLENKSIINTLVLQNGLPTTFTNYFSFNVEKQLALISAEEYLCLFSITSKQFTNYDYVYGLPKATIKDTIYDEQNERIFVATAEGLFIFDVSSESVSASYNATDGLPNSNVETVAYNRATNHLYVGTIRGLSIIDLTTKEVKSYLEGSYVFSLEFDETRKQLYIGTQNHLQIFDVATETISTVILEEELENRWVYALEIHDEVNVLFLGTDYGIYLLDLSTLKVLAHHTGQNSQLTDSHIDGLYFDPTNERLFIANLGIVIYDYRHDFWINLNDANLEEEELYRIYLRDLYYYNNTLYSIAPYNGLYILNFIDSDQDELEDCLEEWLFGTNPFKADTDGDNFSDSEELWAGTDPLDASSYPKEYGNLWGRLLLLSLPSAGLTVVIIIMVVRHIQKKDKY